MFKMKREKNRLQQQVEGEKFFFLILFFLLLFHRTITVNEGQELSLKFACQFYEVSAAESFAGVSLAFQSFLREARSVQLLRALPIRRKLGVNSVSKVCYNHIRYFIDFDYNTISSLQVLGNIFGKNTKDRKKRPSLSI